MNEFLSAIILAIIQGVSEWFPISSSGHLVLFHNIFNYESSLMFDVALHFGTLMAVFVYFGKDIMDIVEALLKGKFKSPEGEMGILIIVASIPAAIVGILFRRLFEAAFSSLAVVAMGFGITGLFLLISTIDFHKREKSELSYKDALWVGIAQAFAILPGISRSGSTIATGILRGIDSRNAMRFSFLISIPAIFGAGIIEIGNNRLNSDLVWATLAAFVVGLMTIHILLKIVSKDKKNLRWFAVYVLLLALGLGIWMIFR